MALKKLIQISSAEAAIVARIRLHPHISMYIENTVEYIPVILQSASFSIPDWAHL